MNETKKVEALRKAMKEKGIDYFIIPTSDPHMSEYVMDRFKSRQYMTNFTGSAGYAIVTQKEALLWADGRYHTQAQKEIKDTPFTLMKWGNEGVKTWEEWLKDKYKDGEVIGFNGAIVPEGTFLSIKEKLGKDTKFKIDEDLVGSIWEDRPEFPSGKVFILSEEYTGETPGERLKKVREEIKKENCYGMFFSTLDDICYLLNIRGYDDLFTPIVVSYLFLTDDKCVLYVNENKLDQTVNSYLKKYGITTKPYESINEDLKSLDSSKKVWVDKNKTSSLHFDMLEENATVFVKALPTTLQKAIKNEREIENMKLAHIKDGAALTKFLIWVKENRGKVEMDEISMADKLHEYRKEVDTFISESFPTISAYASNAAMAHYQATENDFSKVKPKGLYLVDSGGQYKEGTTDVTRTVSMGNPTDEEIKDYTLVLKGHADLAIAKFLKGTTGYVLDILARAPMWKEGIDFKHGTGHGVGFVLGVHEGPHSISPRKVDVPMELGMVVSNEPGIYKEGKHGIRIENVVYVNSFCHNGFGTFYGLEDLTYVPHERELIDINLLTKEEIDYVNRYHKKTYDLLQSYMTEDELKVLKEMTKPL